MIFCPHNLLKKVYMQPSTHLMHTSHEHPMNLPGTFCKSSTMVCTIIIKDRSII